MISLNDVLLAMSNIPVDDPIAEIWGRQLQGGYKIIEYTGSLPITINANGDALLDYWIYGTDGGVGEATENLIDASLSEQTIEIKPSTPYTVSRYINTPGQSASDLRFGVYDENDVLLWSDYLGTWWGENIKVYDNAKYFKITIPNRYLNSVSLVEGTRPDGLSTRDPYPANYIPYGYRLPMTVQSANLFDGEMESGYYDNNGEKQSNPNWIRCKNLIRVNSNTVYHAIIDNQGGTAGSVVFARCYDARGEYIGTTSQTVIQYYKEYEFTTLDNTEFISFYVSNSYVGMKIEICQGWKTVQTVPVYIGENQLNSVEGVSDYVDKSSGKIVRMIGEYTFTGKEALPAAYGYAMRFMNPKFNDANSDSGKITCFSNFFNAIPNDTINYFNLNAPDGSIGFRRNDNEIVLKDSTKFTTGQECINYLKSQYDNGTPVKFWYILKTPTEEDPPVPLPEIPTVDGTTVIDYDGEPKPSQMYVKCKGKG